MDATPCAIPTTGETGGAAVCAKADVAAANVTHNRTSRGRMLMILPPLCNSPAPTDQGQIAYYHETAPPAEEHQNLLPRGGGSPEASAAGVLAEPSNLKKVVCCWVSGEGPAMIDPDTLTDLLVLVGIIVVIGLLVWQAFR
jgi:hypothetical protein